jgi:Fe-S-cluster containining protein
VKAEKAKKGRKARKATQTCRECAARCCRYVAIQLDRPKRKRDYDHIRWYLLHDGVNVFTAHDGHWYLEFETDCAELRNDNLCGIYGSRPRLCREHGAEPGECEFTGEGDPHVLHFSTAQEFEGYLDKQGVKWRWKKHKLA